jgi:hypothetical protein
VNDVHTIKADAAKSFGFEPANTIMIDRPQHPAAHGKNIEGLMKITGESQGDDVMAVFHFSGHGTCGAAMQVVTRPPLLLISLMGTAAGPGLF